jgi:PAS domain S-box-containing protein
MVIPLIAGESVRRPVVHYLVSLAILGAALLLRRLLDPVLGDAFPLVTLFGAVAASVWLGGYRPALLIALLGYPACEYLFIAPRGIIRFDQMQTLVGLSAYLFTCALIIGFGEAMRTAQRRAAAQRELQQVTLRSIGDAVVTTDVDARVTYLNRVAERLTGWAHEDARGQPLSTVFNIVSESTREPVESPATRALREGVVVGLANHTLLIRRDGSALAIDDSAAPIRDEEGRVSGCVLVFRDFSMQRQLELDRVAKLHAARLLAAIVESSDDAIISKTLDGTIQTWNAAAELVFGYTADEAIGRHISLVIPRDRIDEEERIIAKLTAGQRIDHFETERVRRDGRRILVSLTISPIRDDSGVVIGASKIVRDVTAQRSAEEREKRLLAEAAEANAKFHAFFEQGALFAGIMDVDGTLLEPNRLSWEGCGFTREQIVGRPFWEGPWWSPSPALVARVRAGSALAAQGETFHEEIPYFVGDGSERVADLTILPIRDDSGRVLFLAPTGIDITERKRAERQQKRLESSLRKVADQLSEVDRRKDEFLATLAHELRNPLAPLTNMLEVLKRADGDPEARRRARETMARQLGQLVRLVDDLLDINRITHDRLELRQGKVELATIVTQAIEAARPLCESAQHTLTVSLPPEPVWLHADAARLAQVFGNLLNNSCKYTPAGGRIAIAAERDGDAVVVSVRDNGSGIPAGKIDSIFDMFTQLDRSLERAQGGLGIGLTLVRRLVEMHGGTITAESAGEGQGSTFTVRLPVVVHAPDAAEPGLAPADALAPGRRILIVDDNKDSAESLAMLLEITGHRTFVVHDGVAAIAAAEAHRPEVMLLDIGMPRLNGYEVCRRVRQQPWGEEIKIIALTGWGQDEDRRKSQEAGFDGHLVKPVDYNALLELLGSIRSGASQPAD